MKKIFIGYFLLVGGTLWAQQPLEKQIKESKYAIDSIVAARKSMLLKQLASVEDLLEQGKITQEEAEQLKKGFKTRSERQTKQLKYQQAQRLQGQLDEALKAIPADSLFATKDTLAPAQAYEKVVAQVDSLSRRKESDTYLRRYVNRWDIYYPYLALGVLNLSSAEHFGDKRLSPLGSKSFELGLYTNFRLKKNDNLLHLNFGVSWLYQNFKVRNNLFYDREGDHTRLVAYHNELTKSKLRLHYLMIPVDLEWDFSKDKVYRNASYFQNHEGLYLGVGAFVGVLLDANQKINYQQQGDTYKTIIRKDLTTNLWTYGLSAHIGVKGWSLYARYSLAPLFTGNSKGEYPFMIGIRAGR